jgi:hypothetical protein
VREGVGLEAWRRSEGGQRSRARPGLWLELSDDLTSGPRSSVGGGAGQIPFRVGTVLGRGCFSGWADLVPLGPFLFS